MLVYKNDYGWSAYLTNEFNGKKIKCYMPVAFKKGKEPRSDKENIKPTEWFMSCYEGKNGVMPKMIVSEYTIVKTDKDFEEIDAGIEKREREVREFKESNSKITIDSDELPFY